MRLIRGLLVAALVMVASSALHGAAPARVVKAVKVPVGMVGSAPARPAGRIVLGANGNAPVTGGALTVTFVASAVNADGSQTISLVYATTSTTLMNRTLFVDAAGTAVRDNLGNVLVTPAPPALVTAGSNYATQINTMITNAATNHKLDLP